MGVKSAVDVGSKVGQSISELNEFLNILKLQILEGIPSLGLKILWLVFLFTIFKPITNGLMKGFEILLNKNKVDPLLKSFSVSFLKVLISLVFFFLFIGGLGIKATSLVTVLGTAGLAIGLALQGSLSNLAGGVLILLFKPFAKGDFIQTTSGTGTVESIYILYTVILTLDNCRVIIPNKDLANSPVTNITTSDERMIDLIFSASYDNDIELVKETLTDIAKAHPNLLHEKGYIIRLKTMNSSSLDYVFRVWVKNVNYWNTYYDLTEAVKKSFDEKKIEIPYNKIDVYHR